MELEVKNLHVQIEGNEILKGLDLKAKKGEIIALMGPNGSGKSTLAYTLMGHPDYQITKGSIMFQNEDITELAPHKRARKGIFLSFQYPSEITGVSVFNFLRSAYNAVTGKENPVPVVLKRVKEKMTLLNIDQTFIRRYLNQGFSGGEKKRTEILQLAMLEPKLAILDETDSGLDVDALKTVANGINTVKTKDMTVVVITHYQRILKFLKPDKVHIIYQGKIIKSGGHELVETIEEEGYDDIIKKYKETKK